MRKKRISLWLMSLLLCAAVLSGCSNEMKEAGGKILGEIANGVINDLLEEPGSAPETDNFSTGEEKQTSSLSEQEAIPETEATGNETISVPETAAEDPEWVAEDGEYTSKEEVGLYLYLYGHLPSNYITKNEARELGWISSEGNLWDVAPGKSIGGDKFGNYEKLLPTDTQRQYYECDIDYEGGYRNEKRILYSNDGLIFYTEDHYTTVEPLYP